MIQSNSDDFDEEFIVNYLRKIEDNVSIPFAQKRLEKSIQNSLEEEIREINEEVTEKDEQLKTLCSLGNFLLDKGTEITQAYKNENQILENELQNAYRDIEFNKQSVNEYQKLYHELLKNNQNLNTTIQKIEDDREFEKKNFSLMKMELESLKSKQKKNSVDKEQEQLQQTLQKCKDQTQDQNMEIKKLKQNINDQKQQLIDDARDQKSKLTNKDKNHEKEIKRLNNSILQIEQLNKQLQFEFELKVNDFEESKKQLQVENESVKKRLIQHQDQQETNQSLTQMYLNNLITNGGRQSLGEDNAFKSQDLNENDDSGDLNKSGGNSQIKKIHSDDNQKMNDLISRKKGSLFEQLGEIEEFGEDSGRESWKEEKKENGFSDKQINVDKGRTAFLSAKPTHNAIVQQSDPFADFFQLQQQSAKLNSPYIDDILHYDTSGFYEQCKNEDVPFHKWLQWVTDKLHYVRQQELRKQTKGKEQTYIIPF